MESCAVIVKWTVPNSAVIKLTKLRPVRVTINCSGYCEKCQSECLVLWYQIKLLQETSLSQLWKHKRSYLSTLNGPPAIVVLLLLARVTVRERYDNLHFLRLFKHSITILALWIKDHWTIDALQTNERNAFLTAAFASLKALEETTKATSRWTRWQHHFVPFRDRLTSTQFYTALTKWCWTLSYFTLFNLISLSLSCHFQGHVTQKPTFCYQHKLWIKTVGTKTVIFCFVQSWPRKGRWC